MAKKPATSQFEELSLEEVHEALSKTKNALAPTVAFATYLQWDDGIPKIVGTPIRMSQSPAEKLFEALTLSLDMPYDGDDPSLQGMTMGWAMAIQEARKAAQGDSGAFSRIMDRIVGPPVQKSQTMNFNGNLSDFLDKVSEHTKEVVIDVTPEPRPNMDDL